MADEPLLSDHNKRQATIIAVPPPLAAANYQCRSASLPATTTTTATIGTQTAPHCEQQPHPGPPPLTQSSTPPLPLRSRANTATFPSGSSNSNNNSSSCSRNDSRSRCDSCRCGKAVLGSGSRQPPPPTNVRHDSLTRSTASVTVPFLHGIGNSHSKRKIMEKIDIIGRITGEFGRWQLRTVMLIFLCKIPSAWFMSCIIFTAPAPRHGEFFCRPSAVGNWTETMAVQQSKTEWIKIMHPLIEESRDNEFRIDFCNVYDDADAHAAEYFHNRRHQHPWQKPETRNASVIPCDSFMHHSDYRSIITDYDLVCSRDILVATTQFFHLFGVLTGGLLAYYLLKSFSPKSVMLFGMVSQICCGTLTGQVHTYSLHVFFRCLSAVSCAQMYTAGQMIFSDITSGRPRTIINTCFEMFWSIGVIFLPVMANFFNSWSHIYMAISFPTFILIVLWRWIPNSPRWLIANGRLIEAKAILIESADYNERPHVVPADLDHLLQQQAIDVQAAPPPAGWWSIWKGRRAVRHMICVHLAWSIYIVVYYGMLLNIRSFSREHLEVNTVVAGFCEIFGVFTGLLLILHTTRKWLWTGLFNVIAGFVAYTAWTIPRNMNTDARVALLMCSAMVSKVAISSTLAILTTCTTELVSAEKKKMCAFSTIVWARIWLLTAPFVGATIVFGQLVPQTAFATLSIIGGLLTMCLSSDRTIPKATAAGGGSESASPRATTNLPAELTRGADIWTAKGS